MKMLGSLALAAALALTTGLTACSSENELTETPNPEQPAQPMGKGVKVTVTAGISDGATTRSAVTEGTDEQGKPTRTLKFTGPKGTEGQPDYEPGDRLYIHGEIYDNFPDIDKNPDYDPDKEETETVLYGFLDIDPESISLDGTSATFSGTLHTFDTYTHDEDAYDFKGEDPLAACNFDNNNGYGEPAHAYLVHSGTKAGSYTINGGMEFRYNLEDMFADDVETLMTTSLYVMGRYDKDKQGFSLSADYPILNCTLSGLDANHDYTATLTTVIFSGYNSIVTYNIHTDADGDCAFAISTYTNSNKHRYITIKDGETVVGTIDLGTRAMTAKVYNVTRHWTGLCFAKSVSGSVNLSTVTDNILVQDGSTLSGTLATGLKVSIAAGATVTFSGLDMKAPNNTTSDPYTGIDCLGDATINLVGTNSVKVANCDDAAIFVPAGSTLTIEGTGSLEAISEGYGCAGIGGRYYEIKGIIYGIACGDITIKGGTVTAEGGIDAAGIGSGYLGSCGNITIGNGITRVTATQGCRKNGSADPIGRGVGNTGLGTVTFGGEEVCIDGNWNPLHDGYYDDLTLSIDEVNLGDNVSPDPRTVWMLKGPDPDPNGVD